MPVTYNFKKHVSGDTFSERAFAVKRTVNNQMISLEGASIKMQLKRSPEDESPFLELSTDNERIEILVPSEGLFRIKKIDSLDLKPFRYLYDIQITYSNGDVKTYIKGVLPVVEDITQ